MAEAETYVTKANPSPEDWMAYNADLFAALKGLNPEGVPQYTPLLDVDRLAAEAGVSKEEFLDHIREKVGSLGHYGLSLVHSEMDDAWHITVVSSEAVQDL